MVLQINIQVHSLDKLFLILSHHPIPEPERDIHLQMEISLINVNLLHKMAFLLAFPRFSWCCCFFKINQSKIILLSNGHILGVLYCAPLDMSVSLFTYECIYGRTS